jgi:hypothetical protein
MKIFVSWSGSLSKEVAGIFSEWVKNVLQGATTWSSNADIDKGSIWFNEIAGSLADTTAGVLCLTRQNRNAPWVLFEAGALSKGLSSSRVCPLLIDLQVSELSPPLSQLNCTLPHREDMLKLIKGINKFSGEKSLDEKRAERAFEKWWPEFEGDFKKALVSQTTQAEPSKREQNEVLDEILQIVLSVQKTVQERPSITREYEQIVGEVLRRNLIARSPEELEHVVPEYLRKGSESSVPIRSSVMTPVATAGFKPNRASFSGNKEAPTEDNNVSMGGVTE